MSKLSKQEEKELISFLKDWLKSHGFKQKDLAFELNIDSIQMQGIIHKLKELYKKGGMFNIAKNLIKIEQNWLNNFKNVSQDRNDNAPYSQLGFEDILLVSRESFLIAFNQFFSIFMRFLAMFNIPPFLNNSLIF